jgi:hypothetical protein
MCLVCGVIISRWVTAPQARAHTWRNGGALGSVPGGQVDALVEGAAQAHARGTCTGALAAQPGAGGCVSGGDADAGRMQAATAKGVQAVSAWNACNLCRPLSWRRDHAQLRCRFRQGATSREGARTGGLSVRLNNQQARTALLLLLYRCVRCVSSHDIEGV